MSPGFTRDGVVFCAGRDSDLVVGGTTRGFLLSATADAGRSWRRLAATGLPAAPVDDITNLIVSPRFGSDRTVIVQTLGHGTFVSIDAGETFVPLYPGDGPRLTPFVSGIADVPGAGVDRFMLVGASSRLSPTGNVLIDVAARVVRPVAGPPAPAVAFAVSPNHASDSRAVAFVEEASTAGSRVSVYSCDRTFACQRRVASFAARHAFDRAWYLSERTLVVSVRDSGSRRPRLYISQDGGASFTTFTAGQRLLDVQSARGAHPEFELVPTPSGRHSWLRVYGQPGPRPPASRLYRSADGGRSWRLAAFARIVEPGAPGALPPFRVPPQWFTPRVLTQAADDGHIFFGGLSQAGWDLACSANAGRSWNSVCR